MFKLLFLLFIKTNLLKVLPFITERKPIHYGLEIPLDKIEQNLEMTNSNNDTRAYPRHCRYGWYFGAYCFGKEDILLV